MPAPPNATVFKAPMDPADVIDYKIIFEQGTDKFLQPGESIAAVLVTLAAESVAAGLQVRTTDGYATVLVDNVLTVWLGVASGQQSSVNFSGTGLDLPFEVTVTTNSNPARTKQRTYVVKVAQQ